MNTPVSLHANAAARAYCMSINLDLSTDEIAITAGEWLHAEREVSSAAPLLFPRFCESAFPVHVPLASGL